MRNNDRTGAPDGFVATGMVGVIMGVDDKFDRPVTDLADGIEQTGRNRFNLVINDVEAVLST